MKRELQAQLDRATEKLSIDVDPDNGLFEHLLSRNVLTPQQIETCKAKNTPTQRVNEILSTLKRQPDDSFFSFCEVLSAVGRQDLCEYLKQLGGNTGLDQPSISSVCVCNAPKRARYDREFGQKQVDQQTSTTLTSVSYWGVSTIENHVRTCQPIFDILSVYRGITSKLELNQPLRQQCNTELQRIRSQLAPWLIEILEPINARNYRDQVDPESPWYVEILDDMMTRQQNLQQWNPHSVATAMFDAKKLTEQEKNKIISEKNEADARKLLLQYITQVGCYKKFECFLDVLRDNGHEQIFVNIVCEGLVKKHNVDPSRYPQICNFRNQLVNFLDAKYSSLESHLYDHQGLSSIVRETIETLVKQWGERKVIIAESQEVHTQTALDNEADRSRYVREVVHVFVQTDMEQHVVMAQTEDSYSDLSESGQFNVMPLEVLELVLMRTFNKLFSDHYKSQYKTHEAVQSAYSSLADVCYNWWLAMKGWPQSPTKHWFMHKTRRLIQSHLGPYSLWPYKESSLSTLIVVRGVAWCDNKLFVVYRESNLIRVFGPNNKQQSNIELGANIKAPRDIVACHETQQLFIAGESRDARCVWRVSLDGRQVIKWLPNKSTTSPQFRPQTLSVTSRRLLVTSRNDELLLYGADGVELKRIPLPERELLHAVETSRGTFIVSYRHPRPQISEFNVDGHITRNYGGNLKLSSRPDYLSLDSDGRVFVTDTFNDRVLLLNAETLKLERVLLNAKRDSLVHYPHRVHFVNQTRQLIVASSNQNVFQFFNV